MIIVLCGRKRSGKDTFAEAVGVDGFVRVAFADAVKLFCAHVFRMSEAQLYGDQKEVPLESFNCDGVNSFVQRIVHATCVVFGVTEDTLKNSSTAPIPGWDGLTVVHAIRPVIAGCLNLILDEACDHTPRTVMQHVGTELFRDQVHRETWTRSLVHAMTRQPEVDYTVTDARFVNEIEAMRAIGGSVVRIDRPSLPEQIDTHPSEVEWQSVEPDMIVVNDGSLESFRGVCRRAVAELRQRGGE